MNFIKQLFEKWACKHTWAIHNKTDIWSSPKGLYPIQARQTLICTKCGKIKKIVL